MKNKLQLHGFNNLTKTLSFNMYDVCYAMGDDVQKYIDYIDEEFNADRLTRILTEVTEIIGANILNVAYQDYDPQGASVTMLISEEPVNLVKPESVVAHLDKSHVTVHTYPETHPTDGISTFRADIDVSTCGLISPLRALNYLITNFETDIVTVDYRVRGFTRDIDGTKHFIDHTIHSIQDFIDDDIKSEFQMVDFNVYGEKIFHTKMMLRTWQLDDYLFGDLSKDYTEEEREIISARLKHEMEEIFYGRKLPRSPVYSSTE